MTTINRLRGLRPGASPVTRRLLRGYGPVALLVLAVVLIAVFVPSKLPRGTHETANATAAVALGAIAGGLVVVGLVMYVLGLVRNRHAGGSATASGSFLLRHRLARGYAPAAVLALVVALVVVLVPSTAPPTVSALSVQRAHASTATTTPGQVASGSAGGTAGTAGSAGTASSSSTSAPGVVSACSGQSLQVPGDPYSPPCETFSGNNGGSTSRGVTSSTINVTARLTTDQSFQNTLAQLAGASLSDTNADNLRTLDAIAEYFNTHFQFYGRKIKIVSFTGQGSLANELQGYGQAEAEADAATAQSLDSFADITAESQPYSTALWQDGIMGFGDPYLPASWHSQQAPYSWSAATNDTLLAQEVAQYAINTLCPAGSPAAYAGGTLTNAPRKFAGIAPENELYQVAAQQFGQIMDAAGCPITLYEYTLDLGTESQQASNLVAQLKADGYTTVICGCDPIFPVYLSGEAAQENYLPEFVEIGAALVDQDYVGQLYNQQFYQHAFGVSPNAPTVPYTQTLGYAAYEAGCQEDPSICNGQGPSYFVNVIYEQFDQMAIGLQMAGPDLTPSTFQTGMFDYPPREGPYGLWGFNSSQYTTPNDFREVCWSPTTVSIYNNQAGAYIPSTNSGRYTVSDIPKTANAQGTGPGCPIPSS